jgi:hypothetical protein
VVLHWYVEYAPCLHELLRDYPVVAGRCRIAARVIVNENYRGCVLGDRLAKYFARMDERRIQQPSRYGDVPLEPVLRVEDGNVKFLDRQILEALPENLVHISRTSNRNAFIALLGRHAPAELECGMNGDSAGCTDARQTRQCGDRLGRQSPQGTVRTGQNLVANADCRVFFGSTAEEDREKLGRAERPRAVGFEPLSWTFT